MAVPPIWGSSPQSGMGRCFDAVRTREMPRSGYAFNVEFSPNAAYSLVQWRSYDTNSLEQGWFSSADPADWLDKNAVLLKSFEDIDPNGSIAAVTVNATVPVTLVPYCEEAPRIIRTYPSMQAASETYAPNQSIMLYFAAPIDGSTAKFEENNISIQMRPSGSDEFKHIEGTGSSKKYYKDPVWDENRKLVIIEALEDDALEPLENAEISVRVCAGVKDENGIVQNGIKNLMGNPLTKTLEFSWKTTDSHDPAINNWELHCNEDKEIRVTWGDEPIEGQPKTLVPATVYYYLDAGQRQNAIMVEGENEALIENVQPPNADGVRPGQPVSGIRRYDIYIELSEGAGNEDTRLKGPLTIWNIPGMRVSEGNTVLISEEFTTYSEEFKNSDGKNFVLTRDIISGTGGWVPINGITSPFKGKFYGNGHTVTITSFASGLPADIGLFGVVSGDAVIRDLTLVYANPSPISVNATVFSSIGGIVGSASGNTQILNCIVRGTSTLSTCALSVEATGGNDHLRLGGIAGYFEGGGKIENCRAALSVKYEASGEHTGEALIGGIAGETGAGTGEKITINNGLENNILLDNDGKNRLLINRVIITADVTANKKNRNGILTAGGAVGRNGQNTMRGIEFTSGTVSIFNNGGGENYIGGICGNTVLSNIVDSYFLGSIGVIPASSGGGISLSGYTYLGGLVGYNNINNDGNYYINNCNVRGDFSLQADSRSQIGGIFGFSHIENTSVDRTIIITNTFFEDGNITLIGGSSINNAGGFSGYIQNFHSLNNCGALAGNLTVDASSSSYLYAGGFSSDFTGNISNCFSKINIIANSEYSTAVGGFLGFLRYTSSSISNCYAAGTVRVVQNGNAVSNDVNVGGLVGTNSWGTISNSYALGNVIAEKQGNPGNLHIGGLVGYNVGNISNSFSAGQVSAKSALDEAYSGGLVGRMSLSGNIKNSAALGASVTVQTASTRGAGRIYGDPAMNIGNGNFALKTMEIEVDTDYSTHNPGTRPAVSNPNGPDGADTASSAFFNMSLWTEGLGFNNSTESPEGTWNFSRVGIDGHPRLGWE